MREGTVTHVPRCARSHQNASKLDAVLVDRFFTQCLVARREERRERGREGRREERRGKRKEKKERQRRKKEKEKEEI